MHPPSPSSRFRTLPSPAALARPLTATLLLALTLTLTLATAAVRPATAAGAHSFGDPVFSADARGDITTIGNVTTTCDPTYANDNWSATESAAACNGATSGQTALTNFEGGPMLPVNNRFPMEDVDVDTDPGTFNSSTARLTMPAGSTVLWAGLHWNAATAVSLNAAAAGSAYKAPPHQVEDRYRVRITAPGGGPVGLDAAPADGTSRDHWDDTDGTGTYGAFVDVTDLVRRAGDGNYTVANVQSCRGFGGCFGSWSLTVAYANASLPARNLNVWHGWQLTSPSRDGGTQAFTVEGITPPPKGPVSARIGVVQADGDRGAGPDSLDISSPSSPTWKPFTTIDRPLAPGEHDWFNSTVNAFGRRRSDADATPNLLANLNQDIALVEDRSTIGNDDHSVSFRVQTADLENLFSQVVHSAIDIYEPQIAIDKTVAPTGPVHAGDEVTWTLETRNVGIDPVRHAVVSDPLPNGLAYVPGSIQMLEGGPAALIGPKSDRTGDDQADWDPVHRTLTFRLGAGADATTGGTMGIAPAADGSDRLVITYETKVEVEPGASVTNAATATGQGRELADPFGPLITEARDDATISAAPEADLGVTKTDHDAVVRKVGDRFSYTLTATNAGPSPATGVEITDQLDPMLHFVASADGCTAAGQAVTCPIGDLAARASAARTISVEVVSLPGPGRTIANRAVIDGNEPNPDCTGTTPEALCNHDDEDTPQPQVDLGIAKTDGGAVVHRAGDRYTYRLDVTNAGPDAATGVVITDALDRHLQFVSSDRCQADGQAVTCAIGDLAPGATATAELTVRVAALPERGGEIPNVATVAGAEPDPDCTSATPHARCNHDDEHTPWVEETATTRPPATTPPAPPSPPAVVARSGPLPRTGASIIGLVALGTTAVAGGALVLASRRRIAR
ncbi:DUF7507 domain-containing protein [Aquihabitans sp. McL0605]|uniref:DUF7507 domain-containing protein n=1 Tax=Aquihabitans sp. McL0605 TaxID=3415671 RepID=UPI003CF25B46